jgi:pyruvate formate lyase activating enzyme
MRLGHEKGLKNIWVSNGYMSDESLKKIIPYLNAANIDIKSMDEDFYKSNCGARLEPVLSNLKKINNEQIHLEITTLLIPELSDNLDTLKNLANFIASEFDAETPWHISRFSPEISWKLKDKNTTKDEVVYEAYEIGKNAGLKYVYAGNMPGDEKENTYCPTCGELAVRRFGYDVERFDQNGLCANCEKSLNIIG